MIKKNWSLANIFFLSSGLGMVMFGVIVFVLEGDGDGRGSLVALMTGAFGVLLVLDYFLQERMKMKTNVGVWFFVLVLVILSLLVRWSLFDKEMVDYNNYFGKQYRYIEAHGGFKALGDKFYPDSPLHVYILMAMSYFPLKDVYAVKLGFVLFDYLLAFWVYKIVRLKYKVGVVPWLAFFAVIFTPTVVVNASLLSQFDVVSVSFLFASIYFFARLSTSGLSAGQILKYGALGFVMFGVAFSVKPQAVFFILPLLFVFVSSKVRWYNFLLVPLIYVLSIMPSYLSGRSFMKLLFVYPDSADRLKAMKRSGASVYHLIDKLPSHSYNGLGVLFTIVAIVLVVFLLFYKKVIL